MPSPLVPPTAEIDLPDGLRSCDSCGLVTDAGEWPDWVNGFCEFCDPDILDHPDNQPLQDD